MNRFRVIVATLLLLAGTATAAAPALATGHAETTTRTWYLPVHDGVAVDPTTDPFASWWPQTVEAVDCSWRQVDTYRYETKKQRAIVDALDDDGLLTLVGGVPEDQAVYLSHEFLPPASSCTEPSPSPSPTPSETVPVPTPSQTTPEPSTTPTPSETTTPTPTPTSTETTSPSPTPTATSTSTPSPSDTTSPSPTTPSTTPSSTSSPSTSTSSTPPPVTSSTTSPSPAVTQRAQLAATGADDTQLLVVLGGALLIAGGVSVLFARRGQGEHR